jgi:phosphotransferase system  glucose/maltose/N-acetylglucosamine-specific IIC component
MRKRLIFYIAFLLNGFGIIVSLGLAVINALTLIEFIGFINVVYTGQTKTRVYNIGLIGIGIVVILMIIFYIIFLYRRIVMKSRGLIPSSNDDEEKNVGQEENKNIE